MNVHFRMLALGAGATLAASLAVTVPAATANAALTCTPDATVNPGDDLAAVVQAAGNDCVVVSPGTYTLTKQLTIPAGHDIFGLGVTRDDVVIKPAANYDNGINPNTGQPNSRTLLARLGSVTDTTDAQITHLENLTVDGTWGTTYMDSLVIGGGFDIDNVVLKYSRCYGLGITQYHTSITNSYLTYNGLACPNSPPGSAIYTIDPTGTSVQYWAPVIDNNLFEVNTGPAVDSAGVRSGYFRNNTVRYNSGYAGFALFGSGYWTVTGNHISHDGTQAGYPYPNGNCNGVPYLQRAAAIFLCQRNADYDKTTTHNTISSNTVSSYYGILLVGNDETTPYWAPRENTLSSNTTTGSNVGCADDFKGYPAFNPGQWYTDTNHWSGNTCQNSPSYIAYF